MTSGVKLIQVGGRRIVRIPDVEGGADVDAPEYQNGVFLAIGTAYKEAVIVERF